MRFELQGEIVFSKSIEGLEIAPLLEAAKPVLRKGVPDGLEEEACELRAYSISGRILRVTLSSGRRVRAHDGLLRLAKRLSEEIGTRYKIGVREVRVTEYQILIPVKVRPTVELPCTIETAESGTRVIFRNLTEKDLRDRIVDRTLSSLLQEIEVVKLSPRVVKTGGFVEPKFRGDPSQEAYRRGWLREFPGRGQWIIVGPLATLIRTIEEMVVSEIAKPLGFEEALFPKLIPLSVMQKMPGYLDSVPEGMFYVCPPPRDPAAFDKFKTKLKLTKKLPIEELEEIIKEPSYTLAPAQCEPFYEMFSGKIVKLEDLPVKIFDRSGWTYRWEGGGVEGMIRTQEFMRVEFVFLGAPEVVEKIRDEVLDKAVELADKLSLQWRILEATPFYLREGVERKKGTVATYDLEVFLPYKNEWTEVGSFNVHMDKFVKSFRIKEAKGREIWTGCCGFGISRWAVAFLAQNGLEWENWPSAIRERIKEIPSVPRVIG